MCGSLFFFMVFVRGFQNGLYGFLFENDLAILENYFKDISISQRYLCEKFKKYINNVIKKPFSSA